MQAAQKRAAAAQLRRQKQLAALIAAAPVTDITTTSGHDASGHIIKSESIQAAHDTESNGVGMCGISYVIDGETPNSSSAMEVVMNETSFRSASGLTVADAEGRKEAQVTSTTHMSQTGDDSSGPAENIIVPPSVFSSSAAARVDVSSAAENNKNTVVDDGRGVPLQSSSY